MPYLEICYKCHQEVPRVSWMCPARDEINEDSWLKRETPEKCPYLFEQAVASGLRKDNA